jgi:thiamine pyrophosphate-dependent acetolactate synthase large subunit-like protein/CDGSH-type Zn-finger protein/nitrite reductase/ring-hydroxylating ferredoxin subunit
MKKPKITPQKNGPYTVTALEKFTNSRNEAIGTKKVMILCRCGASQNKPYCDGAHITVGFKDQKDPKRIPDKRDSYPGKKVTIHDNRGICSHAAHCTDNLPLVFRMGVKPWINPDGATPRMVKKIINLCPSGALSYSENNLDFIDRKATPEIHISRNGPYEIRGGIELEGFNLGDRASIEHYTLCRCGASKNKPRCDGSHWYTAFKDDEALTISAANQAGEQIKSEWVKVADKKELKNNETKPLSINNQTIVLSKVNDKYGAIEGICPHQGGPLTDGRIDNEVIRCPWHGHAFNPFTGKSLGTDPDVRAFKVEEREKGIFIEVKKATKSTWTVSHILAETMVNWGIKHVFGMVGHSNLGMAEAFRIQEQKGNITYTAVRFEGAAAFACSGYAKASGKPAACLSIAGPGATNLLTGLWDARMDRIPVIALTGQVDTQFLGPGSFQEIDLPAAFEAVAVFSKVVLPNSDHAKLMSLAIKNAIVQRDVAHLIIPDEVQVLDAGTKGPGYPDGWISDTEITPSEESINLARFRISRAKRPVIIVGYGSRNHMKEVITLAEKLNSPVLTTFKAKGQISDFHALGCGVLGRSGTQVASWFMNRSDLLIVFGASFSQHTGIDNTKPLIQVDFDRMALSKFHSVDTPIWGDVGTTASILTRQLPDKLNCINSRKEIAERWSLWRKEKTRRRNLKGKKGLNSVTIFNILGKVAPDKALFSLDVGNNTYSFGRYYECKNHRVILSGYLGSIGFSFPAAMGAAMGQSERQVISISGDGGFAQYMAEFNTAVLYNMNLTHILLNNNELGKISKEQRDSNWPVWQTKLSNPDFAKYANVCGGLGIKVTREEDLESALKKAIDYNGPSLVEIITDPDLI